MIAPTKLLLKGSDNKVQFQTQASGGSATDSNAGGGVTVVANTTALNALTGNAVGDLAVTATNKLYIRQSGGWYFLVTGSNATPVISQAGNASYSLATDGTAVTIEVIGRGDNEGETINFAYNVSSGSLTNGGGTMATVTSSATSSGTHSPAQILIQQILANPTQDVVWGMQ